MSGSRASFLAARREIRERLRSRAFRISTVVQVVAVIAVAAVISLTGGSDTTKVDVGVFAPAGNEVVDLANRAGSAADIEFEPRTMENREAARAAIADGDVDAAVGPGRMLVADDMPGEAAAVLDRARSTDSLTRNLLAAGITPKEARSIVASQNSPPEQIAVDAGNGGGGIAFIATLLLYLALIFCGYAVSSGVVEEKSTRVVELIINAIKPKDLLAGKVAGIGLMGLAQLFLIVLAGVVTALALGEISLPSSTLQTAALSLLFFVLGFALYGCAFAVAGAMVSRQEDSQTTTGPVMILLVAAYIFSVSALGDADSGLAVIGTLFPPFAPLVVPARAAAGALPPEQLVLSVVLMLIACVFLIRFAGRVYESAVLRMGSPMTARQLFALVGTQGRERSTVNR
ncbi:MAG: ABC transporter permease [Actinomycetota bacterium]|nr:ABC transporter permease [Actinomycetota bacterium]